MKIDMNGNAVVLSTKGCYCPENIQVEAVLQEKTATENGVVTADEGFAGIGKVIVGVPTNVPAVIDDTGADSDAILTAENVGKVYYFSAHSDSNFTNGDLYMVENDEGNYKFKHFARSDPNINFAEGTWTFKDDEISMWFNFLAQFFLPQRFHSYGCDWYGIGANPKTGYIYYSQDGQSYENGKVTNVFSMTDGWVNEAYKTVIFGFGEVKEILISSATKISD